MEKKNNNAVGSLESVSCYLLHENNLNYQAETIRPNFDETQTTNAKKRGEGALRLFLVMCILLLFLVNHTLNHKGTST